MDMAKSSSAKVNVRRIGVRSGSEFFRNDADHIWTERVEALSPMRGGEKAGLDRERLLCGLIKDSRRRSGSCGKAGEGSDQRVQIWNADRTHLVITILTIQLLSSNAIQLPTPNGSVQISTLARPSRSHAVTDFSEFSGLFDRSCNRYCQSAFLLLEQDLGHHSLVLVIQQMTMKY